jgi:autotransporter translocation and assembly factor TamB
MKKYLVSLTAAVALSALVVWAQSVDGTWTREVQGKAGTQTQTLTLKSEGGKLTGTLEGGGGRGGGGAAPISDGTLSGSNVSFKVVRDFGGNSVTQVFKGTVSGNELKLTMEVEGGGGFGGKGGGKGPQEMVFTKK